MQALLAAAALLAACAARSPGPAVRGPVVWTPDAVIVGGEHFLRVHNISELVDPAEGGALGATFRVPWLRALRGLHQGSAGPGAAHRTAEGLGNNKKAVANKPAVASAPSAPGGRPPNPDSILGYDIPCGVRNADESSNRIVGGSEARPGEFPWQVSLQKKRWLSLQHICGGAIVAPYWVVTAGHCVEGVNTKDLSVVAGDHDLYKVEGKEQRRKVVRVVSLGYDKKTFANDISLLQLDKRLRFDAAVVAPICVPRPQHHYRDGEAVVSGWGKLAESGGLPARLQKVSLPLIPWETCTRRYRSHGFNRYLHTCQICSGRDQGGQDSCQGDSGGPLVCREEDGRYYLCGVVSWGIGCARAEFPGVYTEVSCYARWINEVLYNEHHYLDPQNEKQADDEEAAAAAPAGATPSGRDRAASAEQ